MSMNLLAKIDSFTSNLPVNRLLDKVVEQLIPQATAKACYGGNRVLSRKCLWSKSSCIPNYYICSNGWKLVPNAQNVLYCAVDGPNESCLQTASCQLCNTTDCINNSGQRC